MEYSEYKEIDPSDMCQRCARCGAVLRKHMIVTKCGSTLGVDCAGSIGVSPKTASQIRAMPTRQAKLLAKSLLEFAIEYRNQRLAALGLTVRDLQTGRNVPDTCLPDMLLLPSEGGTAHEGEFLRACVDRQLPFP